MADENEQKEKSGGILDLGSVAVIGLASFGLLLGAYQDSKKKKRRDTRRSEKRKAEASGRSWGY
jgi:hypothetical protein